MTKDSMLRRRLPLAILILLALAGPAWGQSASIALGTIDTSGFPHLEASIAAFDQLGNPLPLSNNDSVVIEENSIVVATGHLISCPPSTSARPVSIMLVLDHSGSMGVATGAGTRFSIMKTGVQAFLRTLDMSGGTTVGITAFDDLPVLVHPLSSNQTSLEGALSTLQIGGGTQFTSAFIDPTSGGIPLLAGASVTPRHLVFITDGEPFSPPDVPAIIAAAQTAGVTVHVVTISTRLTDDLKAIADGTGGSSIGDIVTANALAGYLASLAGAIQERPLCRVAWDAPMPCSEFRPIRPVRVSVVGVGDGGSWYTLPNRIYPTLALDTLALWFGPVQPGGNSTRQVKITAQGAPFTVVGISPALASPFSVVDWGGTPPPFILQPGASRNVTLRFAPTDSTLYSRQLHFDGTPCSSGSLLLSGGVPGRRVIDGLRLVEPVGGNGYSACTPVPIVWSGVAAERPIRIESSSDGGRTWFRVADSARGLRYEWTPPRPGIDWRVRISTLDIGVDSIFRAAGGGIGGDGPATLTQLGGPTGVEIVGDQLYLVESGRHRVRRVDLPSRTIQTIAGTGSPGYSGDGGPAYSARLTGPNDIAVDGNMLYIADASNNVVRAVDLTTGVITKIAGTGEQGFAGDGGLAVDAQLNLPSFLALAPDALYVTDRANARVRRIDLRTRRIATVAGGGAQPEGDGGSALAVRLLDPAGIAWENGTLYIVERGRNRVRSMASDGGINTIAGSGVAGYSGDGGVPLDARFTSPTGIDVRDSVLLVADEGNNVIRRVDLRRGGVATLAGTGVAGFDGDDGPAHAAKLDRPYGVGFAPWGYAIADFGNDWARMVIGSQAGLSDSTPTSFTVARAQLAVTAPARTFRFDTTAQGVTRSELLGAVLCNHGDVPTTPDTVEIIGADARAFRISSGLTSTPLLPGECVTLELLFTPQHAGPHSAAMVFRGSCSDPDTLWLNGTGRTACGITMIDEVEMGATLGSAKDSLVMALICNTGTDTLRGSLSVEPADGVFTLASPAAPVIPPGGCYDLLLRFTPNHAGEHTARIRFETDGGCGVTSTLVRGTGTAAGTVYAQASLLLPSLLCPDDSALAHITVINGGAATAEITQLALDPANTAFTIISSVPGSPILVPPGDSAGVNVLYRPQRPGTDTVRLLATVARPTGDTTISVLVIGQLETISLVPEPTRIDFSARDEQTADSTVLIINRSTVPITIDSVTTTSSLNVEFSPLVTPTGRVLQPGDTLVLVVRSTDTLSDHSEGGEMLVSFSPSCGASPLRIPLEQMPQYQRLTASPLSFTLPCGSMAIDTIITLYNHGTDTYNVESVEIRPTLPGTSVAALNSTIAPEDSGTVMLVAMIPGRGDTSFTLVVRDEFGEETSFPLTFHRTIPSITIDPAQLTWRGSTLPVYTYDTVTLINTGSADITLTITSLAPTAAEVQSPASRMLTPGEVWKVAVKIMPEVLESLGGTVSLSVRDECGTPWSIPIRGEFGRSTVATLQIPHNTAPAGMPVLMPIRVTDIDHSILDTIGSVRVRVELAWDGTTMRFDSIIGAVAPASFAYDSRTGALFVIFDADFDAGRDTLATIAATTLIGGTAFSPVGFDSIEVMHTSLMIAGIDGSMTLTGDCRTLPPKIGTRPHVVKIAPNPAGDRVSLTVDLEADETVMIALVRGDGTTLDEMIRPTLFNAGQHVIGVDLHSIPAGHYLLRVSTAGGDASVPLVIQR